VDLNLMTRRDAADGAMRHATTPGPLGACDVLMITSQDAELEVDGVAWRLARRDAVVGARAHVLTLRAGTAAVMTVEPARRLA
jgi:hypothetical protein